MDTLRTVWILYEGGIRMNDPEVMERIADALEKIAYYIEVEVGRR